MATAYIGVDLHRTVIQICVLDAQGERLAEERFRYESLEEGLMAVEFVSRLAPGARLAVEALGLNRWFVNACRDAGIDVLVCDPRKLDLKKLGKKTDRRDAREIARRLWLGDLDRMARTYYPSDEEYGRRKLLRVRHRLVQMRQQTVNQIRGMLNAYCIPAPRGVLYTRPSRQRLADVTLPVPELQQAFDALRALLESIQLQIDALNCRVRQLPREEDDLAVLVAELPGIGAQSAATLLAEGPPRSDDQAGQPGAALDPLAMGRAPHEGRPPGAGVVDPDAPAPSQEQGAYGPGPSAARGRLDDAHPRRNVRPATVPGPFVAGGPPDRTFSSRSNGGGRRAADCGLGALWSRISPPLPDPLLSPGARQRAWTEPKTGTRRPREKRS